MKSIRLFLVLFVAGLFFVIGAPQLMAQTGSTGALTGTVTDQSGGVIAGATVTITNTGTGQTRTASTDANGSYKFNLLPPGTYSVTFTASGFKTATVPSVTVNVTETPVLNHKLQVGAQSTKVTVEATTQALQTQNATNGGLVSGHEITSLPLVSRNYTQVISLSPGVVANAATASSVGNGTQDVSANGSTANENNYSMDGVSIVNYVSGMAAQEGSFPGIAIPNPDAIQEFKVQTSQYDASSGRNPGANVNVVTKTGTNKFHGRVWEFNRNNFFNANDFYYKYSELKAPGGSGVNKPQTLKQNTFGFTFGGPVIHNKLFFFGSYQGIRQVNGIGTTGFASGYESNTELMPWNDYADFKSGVCSDLRCTNNVPAYKAYLGNVFNGQQGFYSIPPFNGTGVLVQPCASGDTTCNSTNITNTAVALLQAPGVVKGGYNQGFYFPSAPESCGLAPCLTAISDPFFAREDQYMINTQYLLSSKHTLYERYMYQKDPEFAPFNCFITAGNCNPGAPVDAYYGNHVGSLEWQWLVSPNVVNQARFAFRRDIENNSDPNAALNSCTALPNGATIIPMMYNAQPCGSISTPALGKQFPEMLMPPQLDILGIGAGPACPPPGNPTPCVAWSQGGNFAMISSNFINTFIASDSLAWNHGNHSLRFGFEATRVQYNNTIPSSGRGELLMPNTGDFLTSSSGPTIDGTPATPFGGIFLGFGLKGPLTHYNRANEFAVYAQDDWKVTPKLTLNLGLRWEYSGFPSDVSGEFTNVWQTELTKLNTGSALQNLGFQGTLIGFVVPSNFAVSKFGLTAPSGATGVSFSGTKTLLPGTPLKEFAPRIGLAWQPFSSKFVVRAGYGWFYDTIYANLLIDNQLNLPPYSGAGGGPAPLNAENTLQNPWKAGANFPLAWTPRYMVQASIDPYTNAVCPVSPTLNGEQGICSSGFGYTSDSPVMGSRMPLVQEYNLDLQYEFAHGWIADIGYVGSHGIHLYDWSRNINVARLVPGAFNNPTAQSGFQNTEMIASSLPYNDPANPNPITGNTIGSSLFGVNQSNLNERVSYLGFTPGGVASTSTLGDSVYNSLQAQVRHQFSNGLLMNFAYTWSKSITNINTNAAGSGIQPAGQVIFGAANSNNPLDLKQQYGLASFNRSQRAVITYVYNLPYKNTHGFAGKALGGWSVSGVTTIQNGLPFWMTDSGGGTIYGAGTSRALLADPINCSASTGNCQSGIPIATSGSTTQRATPGNSWVNAAAFTPFSSIPWNSPYCIGGIPNPFGTPTFTSGNPPVTVTQTCGQAPNFFGNPGAPIIYAGTGYGNEGIGVITGPGQFNFDMSLIKSTKVTEWGTLEFHFDAFNVFNHPQFNLPYNLDVNTAAQFGQITSTSVTPRVLQFGLKFLF